MTDRELLTAGLRKDGERAFSELVGRNAGAVYAAALRIVGDSHLAEDVSQAVFVLLTRKAASLPAGVVLTGWLLQTTRHVALCALRERARRARREEDAVRMRESSGATESAVDREAVRRQLDEALDAIPAIYRDAVVLCHLRGLSQEQAAREAGCRRETLAMRTSRGLEKLRAALLRRGVSVPAVALGGILAAEAGSTAVPVGLVAAVQAACLGQAAVPPAVLTLTQGAAKAMFWMKVKLAAAVVAAATTVGAGGTLAVRLVAGEPTKTTLPAQPTPAGTQLAPVPDLGPTATVLDDNSPWRCCTAYKCADVRTADGKLEPYVVEGQSAKPAPAAAQEWAGLPASDWASPDFDDSAWRRIAAPTRWLNHDIALLAIRGRFEVSDPAQVRGLELALTYYGGVVVYVNGREVARSHMTGEKDKPDLRALAEDYPLEAWVGPDGKPMRTDAGNQAVYGPPKPELAEVTKRLDSRLRKLDGVKVPAGLLRKGANVLAIEVHRSPVAEAVGKAKNSHPYINCWVPVGLRSVRLGAAPAGAVAPNLAGSAGIRVRSCLPFETVSAFDGGDACEPVRPILVAAARNGVFSGRLVVDSGAPIKGLKAEVSDLALAGGGGTIPASAVRVRVAEPAVAAKSWAPPHRFDGLLDAIPAEVPVVKAPHWPQPDSHTEFGIPEDRNLSSRALAPIWLTVRVPRDASPGKYEGVVTVSAEGLKPAAVPFRMTVSDWTVPDPKDFRIHNFAYLSEDAVALHYGVERWSDKHFELMGKSMALMAEINSRQAIVNLAVDFYGFGGGNAESMVRWVKQPDGSFKYDFTIFDKYLDLAAKAMGKPTLLRVNCWNEVGKKDGKLGPGAGKEMSGRNMSVTVLDPATGKLEPMEQPTPGTEESFKFWKPVLDEVRKKVEARGWWDVTAMGWNSYCFEPVPEVVSVYRRIWPDGKWSYTAHNGNPGMAFKAAEAGASMPVLHADTVWNHGAITPRGCRALLAPGRREKGYWCFTWRSVLRDHQSLECLRSVGEDEILRGQDGYSDFGADLFPVKKPAGGYWCLPNGRGTGGPNDGTRAMLAPGPDGAVSTERFEMLREGMELAEAVLFIQRALDGKKLGAELAQKAEAFLEERGRDAVAGRQYFAQRHIPGRFEQDGRLLALAAEVAKAAGGK